MGERGCRSGDVLAVVEDQQQPARTKRVDQRLRDRLAALLRDAEDTGRCQANGAGIRDGSKVNEPRSVGEVRRDVRGGFDGQPGLAQAARPEQRHQPVCLEQVRDFANGVLATKEAGGLHGQVADSRCYYRRDWTLRYEPTTVVEEIHTHRSRDVLDAMFTFIEES